MTWISNNECVNRRASQIKGYKYTVGDNNNCSVQLFI